MVAATIGTMSIPLRVRLGRTELMVSPICYGTWQLSPRFWGPMEEQPLLEAMRRAFDVGVNFYDTANAYGEGLAEEVLGRGVRDLPRDQIVIATKAFWHIKPDGKRYGDLSHDYLISECEASLGRLRMDYVDLYQLHSYEPLAPFSETVSALEKLKKQGKIRAYGTSNWSVEQMRTGDKFGSYGSTQPPYSLIRRDVEQDILPYCQANDVGTLVYSPLHKGLLSGKYNGTETFIDFRAKQADFQGERFKLIADRVQQCGRIAGKYGLSILELVLTVTLMHPGITCAIVGVKKPEHIEQAAASMGKTISREDFHDVRALLTIPDAGR